MCARGVSASRLYRVIMMFGTPYVLSSMAAAPPAGPLPTISTSVSTASPMLLLSDREGVRQLVPRVGDPAVRRSAHTGREVDDQRLLHAEHRVGVQIVAAGHEELRNEPAVTGRADHEVQVRRAVLVAAGRGQQLPDRPVV